MDFINIFKNRLDNYWFNQDVVFDYTVALAGIGDRSEYIGVYYFYFYVCVCVCVFYGHLCLCAMGLVA